MQSKTSHMYNEKQKIMFFESEKLSEKSIIKYKSIFGQTSKWESENNMDICCVNDINVLQQIFNNVSGVSFKSSYTVKSTLKRYFDWCVRNNIKGAVNIADQIKISSEEGFKKTMVPNPMHLQKFLNAVLDEEDNDNIDNTFRCLYWLAYSGMSFSDAMKVSDSDVDFETMSVKYNGESYPIYMESLKAFHKCVKLKEFNFIHPRYESVLPRFNSDQLLRGIKADMSEQKAQSEMSRKIKASNYPVKLTYAKARMSGVYYRMYEQEVYGVVLDFQSIALKYMSNREYHFKDKHSYQRVRNTIAHSFKDDYYKWKLAFGLQ